MKTGIQSVYGFQKPNWILAFAGMTDWVAALFYWYSAVLSKKVAVVLGFHLSKPIEISQYLCSPLWSGEIRDSRLFKAFNLFIPDACR